MEFRVFDQLTQRMATGLGRRSALLAASGLATLPLIAAAQEDDLSAAAARRGKRGPRGKRGKPGKPAGANLVVVTQACANATGGLGETQTCTATCDSGFAATGGGFLVGEIFGTLAVIRGSAPSLDGTTPIGWEATIEFLQAGQQIDYSAYAVCAPTGN